MRGVVENCGGFAWCRLWDNYNAFHSSLGINSAAEKPRLPTKGST